ncbi:MAG: hydroxyethylthiazole kinase [archaeon]|nr:hydroxyethylthiazole kinase [archaeon]
MIIKDDNNSNNNNPNKNLLKEIIISFNKVKEENPLTYCMTNTVTINGCANAILAIGGSPIMTYNKEEIEDIIKISKSLVINIGNPSNEEIESMKLACKYANTHNIPIIFDPVGVGISKLRNDLSLNLIKNYNLTAIRGNMSEIKAIANLINLTNTNNNNNNKKPNLNHENYGKGVDVNTKDMVNKDNLLENASLVKELAKKLNTIIIASGPIDLISNGKKTYSIENGDEMMPKITGSGCMLSSIVGTYITELNTDKNIINAITASLHMTLAGEKAGKIVKDNNLGTGSFNEHLLNNLYLLKEEDFKESKLKNLNI